MAGEVVCLLESYTLFDAHVAATAVGNLDSGDINP